MKSMWVGFYYCYYVKYYFLLLGYVIIVLYSIICTSQTNSTEPYESIKQVNIFTGLVLFNQAIFELRHQYFTGFCCNLQSPWCNNHVATCWLTPLPLHHYTSGGAQLTLQHPVL